MSLGVVHYDETSIFASKKSADKYADSAIAQPDFRYAQADALIQSLLLEAPFSDLSLEDRNFVTERTLSEIRAG